MIEKFTPTTEYLQEAVTYFPKTGKFFWKKRPIHHFKNTRGMNIFNSSYEGKEAGCLSIRRGGRARYLTIRLTKGIHCYCHRLAMVWMGIEIANGMQIDHINHDGTDNRFENLQIVTNQENNFNSRRRAGKNGHLPRGCDPRPNGKFTVKLRHNGIWHQLGTYSTLDEVRAARKRKAEELGIKNFLE